MIESIWLELHRFIRAAVLEKKLLTIST